MRGRWHPAPQREPIALHWRRIYVLPTGAGVGVAMLLVVLWVLCVNYQLGLGYFFVFLLFQMGCAGLWGAWDALRHLHLHAGRSAPVFAGETAQLVWHVQGRAAQPPVRVRTRSGAQANCEVHFDVGGRGECRLHLPTTRRGWLRAGVLTVETRWPLGLWRAWSIVHPAAACLVYPRPENDAPPPPVRAAQGGVQAAASAAAGTDDFAGLRRFEPGQSPRQIAWKAVARGAPLLSKRFLDEARRAPWHLDWDDTAALRDVEQRLSRLTAWVLRADADGRDFSLHLPNAALAQGTGVAQREQALRLLATFGHDEEGAP